MAGNGLGAMPGVSRRGCTPRMSSSFPQSYLTFLLDRHTGKCARSGTWVLLLSNPIYLFVCLDKYTFFSGAASVTSAPKRPPIVPLPAPRPLPHQVISIPCRICIQACEYVSMCLTCRQPGEAPLPSYRIPCPVLSCSQCSTQPSFSSKIIFEIFEILFYSLFRIS